MKQTTRPPLRPRVLLLLPILAAACSPGGGGATTPQAQPFTVLAADLLGPFTEVRTAGHDPVRVRLLRSYALGEDGRRDARQVRADLQDLVRRAGLPDERRLVASLTFLAQPDRGGGDVHVGLDSGALGRVVAEAVRLGAADPQRARFRERMRAELAPLTPIALDPGVPLAVSLTVPVMIEHIAGPGYEEVGRALRQVLDGSLGLEQSNAVVHAQVNRVLADLVQQFRRASETRTPLASMPEFERARQVLGAVERVSDFVFSKLFTGDRARRIGETIRTVTRSIGAVVELGGAIFSGGATGLLSPNLINTVLGLFGLDSESAVEQRLDQLQRTVEQIGQLMALTRAEMHQRFDRIEGQIAQLYRRVDQMFRAMVQGFEQLSEQLRTGFAGLDDLLRTLRSELGRAHDDVRVIYEAVRWYADEAARRAMEEALVQFEGLLAAAATGDRSAFAQARSALLRLASGEVFVRTPPLRTLGDVPGWLPSPTADEAFARVAVIGALPPLAYVLGAPRVEPVNFACLHFMATGLLDLVRSRPELLASAAERLSLVRELDTLLTTARAMIPGLSDLMRASLDLIGDRAAATATEWSEILAAFRPLTSLAYSGTAAPGPQLLDYLATPYFDAGTGATRLPFGDEDGGFTLFGVWPPAPGSFPPDERVYEFEQRRQGGSNGAIDRFRRSAVGHDHLRLGIALGLIRVVETSRSSAETLGLWWRVPSVVDDPELRSLDGTKLCDLALIPGEPALPPRVRITGVPTAYQASFGDFYSRGVQPRVRTYLRVVRDHVARQLSQNSEVVMQSLVELYAAGSCLRYAGEVTLEAAIGDRTFAQTLGAALDQPLVFHERLLSGRFALQSNQTPGDYRQQIVAGLLQLIADLRAGSSDLPEELREVRFYDQLFRGLPEHARNLTRALDPLLPELSAARFRFAAIDEVRELLDQVAR